MKHAFLFKNLALPYRVIQNLSLTGSAPQMISVDLDWIGALLVLGIDIDKYANVLL